jgi:hypothetical protein
MIIAKLGVRHPQWLKDIFSRKNLSTSLHNE